MEDKLNEEILQQDDGIAEPYNSVATPTGPIAAVPLKAPTGIPPATAPPPPPPSRTPPLCPPGRALSPGRPSRAPLPAPPGRAPSPASPGRALSPAPPGKAPLLAPPRTAPPPAPSETVTRPARPRTGPAPDPPGTVPPQAPSKKVPPPVAVPRTPSPVTVQPQIQPTAEPCRPELPPRAPRHDVQPSTPQGLECLAALNIVVVKRNLGLLESFTRSGPENVYEIWDAEGHRIFSVVAATDCCTSICPNYRPFDMKLIDVSNEQQLIHFSRPLAYSSMPCFPPCCYLQSLTVESEAGTMVGSVKQNWSNDMFNVMDETGKTVYYIRGPFCHGSCCSIGVQFEILYAEDPSVRLGIISRTEWPGLNKEVFLEPHNFGIYFPAGADAKMRVTLLGACILIHQSQSFI